MRFFHSAMLFQLSACALFAENVPPLKPAWQDLSKGLASDARRVFADAAVRGADRRAVDFGEAVSLLRVQPKTRGNIDRATGLFESVIAVNGADDLGLTARYLLARIAQVHRFEPDLPAAQRLYDALYREHPAHPLAQMGFVKSTLLKLYETVPPEERVRRVEAAAAAASALTDRDARRNYFLVMATIYQEFALGDEAQLAYLLQAAELGPYGIEVQSNLLVRVAELSRRLGRKDAALRHYEKFLAEFQRDTRVTLVQERIRELGTPATP